MRTRSRQIMWTLLAIGILLGLEACNHAESPFPCESSCGLDEHARVDPLWDPGYEGVIGADGKQDDEVWQRKFSASLRMRLGLPAYRDLARVMESPRVQFAKRVILIEKMEPDVYWWGIVVESGADMWCRCSGPLPFPPGLFGNGKVEYPYIVFDERLRLEEQKSVCGVPRDKNCVRRFLKLVGDQDDAYACLGRERNLLFARANLPRWRELAGAWIIYMCLGGKVETTIAIDRPEDKYLREEVILGEESLDSVPKEEPRSGYSNGDILPSFPGRLILNGMLKIMYRESLR